MKRTYNSLHLSSTQKSTKTSHSNLRRPIHFSNQIKYEHITIPFLRQTLLNPSHFFNTTKNSFYQVKIKFQITLKLPINNDHILWYPEQNFPLSNSHKIKLKNNHSTSNEIHVKYHQLQFSGPNICRSNKLSDPTKQ
jgi:hypothetical protein